MSLVVQTALLDVDLPAVPQSVPVARRAVMQALSGIAVDRVAVSVVVSEAVTNAVVHAYRDRTEPGRVRVSASLNDAGVEIGVADDGLGMYPRVDSPGAGLGVPLMTDLADQVDVRSGDPRGTRIAAHFCLMGPAGPHGRRVQCGMLGRAKRRTAAIT